MASKRELVVARAQSKRLAKSSQPKARQKTRFDTTLFSTVEDYQWYKQYFAQRQVISKRNINFPKLQHFGFERLFTIMGWLSAITISKPVSSTLV